jgi:hypothetical protein
MNPGLLSAVSPSDVGYQVVGTVRAYPVVTRMDLVASAACALSSTQSSVGTDINSLKEFFKITGKGILNWAGFRGSTLATYRFVVEVDGVFIADANVTVTTSNDGIIAVGAGAYSATSDVASAIFQPIPYKQSLRVLCGAASASASHTAHINVEVLR